MAVKKYITEVVAENFSLLESKKVTESRRDAAQPIEENPFNGVSDDDLPF